MWMTPRHDFAFEDLSIQGFHSPTDSKGKVVIWDAKGRRELRLTADLVSEADMVFVWKIAQKGRVVQEMRVRIVPGPPVKVFVDGQEIEVLQD
jgi:hypothetical protein